MKTVLSERGQLVIPKRLRDRLGLRPGQVLECREEKGRLVLVKADEANGIDQAFGILARGRSTNQRMRELRGDVDAT